MRISDWSSDVCSSDLDFWGRGYATEAASACRDHALHTLDRSRVVSITSRENVPSQRVAERVHQRREVFSKISRATGLWIGRYLYITEKNRDRPRPQRS